MTELIRNNTPIEEYKINGKTVYVKREDLSTIPPLPPLAKLRGAKKILEELSPIKIVGHHDSWYSKAGQGIAILSKEFGIRCVVGYPDHKGEIPQQFEIAKEYGAELRPVRSNYIRINYAQTKKYVESIGGYMMPFALACPESTIAVSEEAKIAPVEILGGSIIISVGSGTMLSGVMFGIKKTTKIYGISAGMSEDNQMKNVIRLLKIANKPFEQRGFENLNILKIIPPPTPYENKEIFESPFPTHANYDRKAWKWLVENLNSLKEPVLFWNIGA